MPFRSHAAAATLTLVVVALLACSPDLVITGIIGSSNTPIPTGQSAISLATSPPASPSGLPVISTPTIAPTLGLTGTTTVTPAPATKIPPPPPPLPLRSDLPALTLKEWPRPANDNGRCIHFLSGGYYSQRDFEIQIPRMKALQMRWVLALYADENQLRLAAAQFKAAGIIPVWRKTMRAYQRYYAWDRDIQILNQVGLPPYFQIYNEPDLPAEWDDREVNRDAWIGYFIQAAKDVYNAGGFVGLQTLDENWLSAVIQAIKAQKGDSLFGRMFFVPHPYGVNHPPNWVQDDVGVLGYRTFANVFQKELGFVPPFIAGEGGWKYKAAEDSSFPPIDDKLHAQYHLELFNWFRTGKVSDGQPLPDYLFAFCPWLLAGHSEIAAWYDSPEGERTQTIQAISKIPPFTRKFSWTK